MAWHEQPPLSILFAKKKIFDRTENWTSEVVAIVQTVMTYCIIGLLLPPVKKQAICGSERAHST